ncbi:MAG: hypothetical protein JWO67_6738 [Streptosporangiaceae bacterium]|jgi:hypothetical protein|nr:hypothetical protein [Streptosporangiaceae bacterium]
MAHQAGNGLPSYEEVTEALMEEFAGVHPPALVARCVGAARHSAEDVTGGATPEQVCRIARKHLEILATVAAERRRPITFGNTP